MNNLEKIQRSKEVEDDVDLIQYKPFNDIVWLMAQINVKEILEANGFPISNDNGETIRTFCPDHEIFVGKESSDPNWVLNIRDGKTTCYTEGRDSNLVYTFARRMFKKEKGFTAKQLEEVVEWLLGNKKTMSEAFMFDTSKLKAKWAAEDKEKTEALKRNLENFSRYVTECPVCKSGYDFFMSPPNGKFPTNINKETVDFFKVFQKLEHYYKDRVCSPIYYNGEIEGIVATDILGETKWLRANPEYRGIEGAYKKERKKVIYNKGFLSGKFLYNFDVCKKSKYNFVILVEGVREVMKLWQEGFDNAVAIFGCDIKKGQVNMLYELGKQNVVIMLDGDDVGRDKSQKMYEDLKGNFITKIAYTPLGYDPKHLDKSTFLDIFSNLFDNLVKPS